MTFNDFRTFCKNNRDKITVKGVAAKYPFNYGNNRGYLITVGDLTKYVYFREDGVLLDKSTIRES